MFNPRERRELYLVWQGIEMTRKKGEVSEEEGATNQEGF